MNAFLPEGWRIDLPDNQAALRDPALLELACRTGAILEARASLCDSAHNLMVDLGCMRGLIPREEAALGIAQGNTRDIAIISRVGKPVSFVITGFFAGPEGKTMAMLSRSRVQRDCTEQYLSRLAPGDIIPARVTHLEPFGSFVDVGCGVVSLIPIDLISVSRIAHPRDRFRTGQNIRAVVTGFDSQGRLCLSHKELLGSWEENAARFEAGATVPGIVRSVEDYGIFVELAPNLAGLAEPREGVRPGMGASVFIKSILPERMKVKLILVDTFERTREQTPLHYYLTSGHLDRWTYSPPGCQKVIESVFQAS